MNTLTARLNVLVHVSFPSIHFHISSSSRSKSNGGYSPTRTFSGRTKPPYKGRQLKYRLPCTLRRPILSNTITSQDSSSTLTTHRSCQPAHHTRRPPKHQHLCQTTSFRRTGWPRAFSTYRHQIYHRRDRLRNASRSDTLR